MNTLSAFLVLLTISVSAVAQAPAGSNGARPPAARVAQKAPAIFPPKGYMVHEDSESPDGRYAVLVPSYGEDQPDPDQVVNYLADVKAQKTLGKLQFAQYYAGANRLSLQVVWAPDSSWCVLEQDGRWEFGYISVVEIQDGTLRQQNIEGRVEEMLDRELKKQKEGGVSASNAFIRAGADRKIRLRAVADNNPKRFEDRKTKCALFQGTYDLAAKKWTITDARAVTDEQNDLLSSAYEGLDPRGRGFKDDEEKAKWLDEQLNAVYGAIRLLVPPARFAAVKEEQVAWLKAQPKDASAKQRGAAWTARIKILDKLLW